MSNRRRQDHDPLAGRAVSGDIHAMDEAVYGAIGKVDAGMQTAFPISIMNILPDPRQPRRQVPSVVRQYWDGEPVNTSELFGQWAELFAEESGRTFAEIEAFIDTVLEGEELSPAEVYQGEQTDARRSWGVIGGALLAVVSLAAEIHRDGLTNPITVVRAGNHFVIETGERRWLAFHLLNLFYPDSVAWERIPAREVQASSVWRQASENMARAQLNAISMARQLAILLMDLHGNERFQSFDALVQPGQCDRAYYAQVADGNVWRIPPGKGEQLVSAMGIKNPVQLRQYRALLRLPDVVWMLADDLNWTEYFIRTEIVEKAFNDGSMAGLAYYHADQAGYRVTDGTHTVSPVTVSDDEDVIPAEEAPPVENADDLDEQPETPPPPTQTVPAPVRYLLTFAYGHATKNPAAPWFSASQSYNTPETLNKYVSQGLLEIKGGLANASPVAAVYRIAPDGSRAIDKEPILYSTGTLPNTQPPGATQSTPAVTQTPPTSGGAAHAGAPPGTINTPPVQSDPDPLAQQRKLEERILKQLQGALDQVKFSIEKLPFESVKTVEGQQATLQELQRLFHLARAIRDRMPKED